MICFIKAVENFEEKGENAGCHNVPQTFLFGVYWYRILIHIFISEI